MDRVRIAGLSQQQARIFGPSLAVVAVAPESYTRGCCYDRDSGQWDGPDYRSTSQQTGGRSTTIDWSFALDRARPNEADAARHALVRGWEVAEVGIVFVPHVVAGREVGTIPGAYAITKGPAGAQREAALAFSLASGMYAVVRFALVLPEGSVVTNGLMVQDVPLEAWNHQHAFAALSAVRLEGNLPPSRITARASRQGRLLAGTVVDRYGHPLVGAPVQLEQRIGRRWIMAGKVLTGERGNYRLRVRKAGTYRTVARLGSKAAKSRVVRVARRTLG